MSASNDLDFDVAALTSMSNAAHDPSVALAAYEAELEKIAAWGMGVGGIFDGPLGVAKSILGFPAAAARGVGDFVGRVGSGVGRGLASAGNAGAQTIRGAGNFIGDVGSGVGRGLTVAGGAIGSGAQSLGRGVSQAAGAVGDASRSVRSSWHGVTPDVLRQGDEALLASKNQAMAEAYRKRLGLDSTGAAATGAAATGPAAATGAAAGTPSFLDTHFGLNQLTAPAGSAPGAGISNWWAQTTDAQKLKTLGAAGLGLGGLSMGTQMISGRPQINMGPTVTT